ESAHISNLCRLVFVLCWASFLPFAFWPCDCPLHRCVRCNPCLLVPFAEADNRSRRMGSINARFIPESRHVRCKSKCLLWANSGHLRCKRACPLYPLKRTHCRDTISWFCEHFSP